VRIRAAVLEEFGRPLVVQEVDLAEPRAGEALVRLVACGVCHTDLYTASGADPSGYAPCVLGHEGAGIVEAVGEGVTLVRPGDHVVTLFAPECGECVHCRSERTNRCVAIRDQQVVKKKAVYVAVGVTLEGTRDCLGLWIEKTEGARFWTSVMTELRNRGVKDVLFVCTDGLTGLHNRTYAMDRYEKELGKARRYGKRLSIVMFDLDQFKRVNGLYEDALKTLDAPKRYPLFVSQTPIVNAGAYGMHEPFIILNSGTVALLDDDEHLVEGDQPAAGAQGGDHRLDPLAPAFEKDFFDRRPPLRQRQRRRAAGGGGGYGQEDRPDARHGPFTIQRTAPGPHPRGDGARVSRSGSAALSSLARSCARPTP